MQFTLNVTTHEMIDFLRRRGFVVEEKLVRMPYESLRVWTVVDPVNGELGRPTYDHRYGMDEWVENAFKIEMKKAMLGL